MEDSHEAEEQIANADVIVLNNMDLLTPEEQESVEACIRSINRSAGMLRAERANVPLGEVLDRASFDLSRIAEMEPDFLSREDDQKHNDVVNSVRLTSDAPLDRQTFNQWIGAMLMEEGRNLLRTKDVPHFQDDYQRSAFAPSALAIRRVGKRCAAAVRARAVARRPGGVQHAELRRSVHAFRRYACMPPF